MYGTAANSFHILKFEAGQLSGYGNTPIDSFSSKVKTPPSQKKKHVYKGDRFVVQAFYVTPSDEFLIAGQLTKRKMVNKEYVRLYTDVVCFHFDSEVNLKAQYAVEKVLKGSKTDALFPMIHNFIPSPSGDKVYWEAFEVKTTKGYANYWDSYYKRLTIYANYFPRIASIDLSKAEISDFVPIGGKKGNYLLQSHSALLWNADTKTRYYIGRDEKFKKLFVAQYQMN